MGSGWWWISWILIERALLSTSRNRNVLAREQSVIIIARSLHFTRGKYLKNQARHPFFFPFPFLQAVLYAEWVGNESIKRLWIIIRSELTHLYIIPTDCCIGIEYQTNPKKKKPNTMIKMENNSDEEISIQMIKKSPDREINQFTFHLFNSPNWFGLRWCKFPSLLSKCFGGIPVKMANEIRMLTDWRTTCCTRNITWLLFGSVNEGRFSKHVNAQQLALWQSANDGHHQLRW